MHRFAFGFITCTLAFVASAGAAEQPNILWIISEDNGPQLGAYGDPYADTPNIDALAAEGNRYRVCWSNAPVCAPARTTLISGIYPTSTGAEHMRSLVPLPETIRFFPQFLREAGYFTTNARKEDFNLETPGKLWDLSNDANRPWQKRGDDQPFFSVINIPTSHESQLRKRPHTLVHDPAKVRIPAYHPDTPEVRHDWAQYYDKLTEMDREVGEILGRLEQDGLKDSTIVFYFGDHGSGMPRSKRWPYDSGLHVPLVVRIPEQFQSIRPVDYKAGGESDRLVAFVDFGVTAMSLAGVKKQDYHQGEAFLGPHAGKPNQFLHGYRGRMDERTDCVRSVTDGRFVYIRNYMPHRIYGQHVGYMFQMPTTQVWQQLYEGGKSNEAQSIFWEEKPGEELYDRQTDRDEVKNLVDSPAHAEILARFRNEQRAQVMRVRDVGLLPEVEMHARAQAHGLSPYALGHDDELYPLDRVLAAAELASNRSPGILHLRNNLESDDAGVRYWGCIGVLTRGEPVYDELAEPLRAALDDSSASVRIAAAECVGRFGEEAAAKRAVEILLKEANYQTTSEYAATSALIVIDELLAARPELVTPHADALRSLPSPAGKGVNPRAKEYPNRLKDTIVERLTAAN